MTEYQQDIVFLKSALLEAEIRLADVARPILRMMAEALERGDNPLPVRLKLIYAPIGNLRTLVHDLRTDIAYLDSLTALVEGTGPALDVEALPNREPAQDGPRSGDNTVGNRSNAFQGETSSDEVAA